MRSRRVSDLPTANCARPPLRLRPRDRLAQLRAGAEALLELRRCRSVFVDDDHLRHFVEFVAMQEQRPDIDRLVAGAEDVAHAAGYVYPRVVDHDAAGP